MRRFHLIANAHLDPVWLWDWREGMNEAVSTTRAMLAMLDEFPELTVVRGESSLYVFLEREVPDVFSQVRTMIAAGRWETVGGSFIQADNNLPTTETLRREFEAGQDYFLQKFGRRTETAWFPDAFGHSAGLPQILAANGISQMAHCRPFASMLPLAQPVYWWLGPGNTRILAYRSPVDWYCHERHTLIKRLDAYLRAAEKCDLHNLAVFYGLGNHGGGPTRRMMHDLREWGARHPDIELVHSGLGRYFSDVRHELAQRPELVLPEHRGELGFCERGCYASMAKFKFPFRRTEHAVLRAGKVAMIATAAGATVDATQLSAAWKTVLFNAFHDILPGSSIERAYVDQLAQIGGAADRAQRVEFAALNALARQVDTSVPAATEDLPTLVPFLVCNPHPFPFSGPVEFEVQLDWRPLANESSAPDAPLPLEVLGEDGLPRPFQRLRLESRAVTHTVSRVRLVTPVQISSGGWTVIRAGYRPGAVPRPRQTGVRATAPSVIANEAFSVTAAQGAIALLVSHRGRSLFPPHGLEVWLTEDHAGSWGEMQETRGINPPFAVREKWAIAATQVLENGPELARIWVRFAGRHSRLDLTLSLFAETDAVHLSGRLFLDERSARVSLVLPGAEAATFEVPGGTCTRGPGGDISGIGHVRATGAGGGFAFASDSLSGFRLEAGCLHATLARATRYADDVATPPDTLPHLPAVDCGELCFLAVLAAVGAPIEKISLYLQQPVVVQSVPAYPAPGPRCGTGLQMEAPVCLLSAEPEADGIRLVVQNSSTAALQPRVTWRGTALEAPSLQAWEIAVWTLPFGSIELHTRNG